jgi:hypothetical protein
MSPTEFSTKRCGESSRCVMHVKPVLQTSGERRRCQLSCRNVEKTTNMEQRRVALYSSGIGTALLDRLIDGRRVGWTIGSVGAVCDFLELAQTARASSLWGRSNRMCDDVNSKLEAGAIESKAPRSAARAAAAALQVV